MSREYTSDPTTHAAKSKYERIVTRPTYNADFMEALAYG